jgi:NAD(P)-dependent dehydrogenase (short-subunit alcohol dehydrogenase family)
MKDGYGAASVSSWRFGHTDPVIRDTVLPHEMLYNLAIGWSSDRISVMRLAGKIAVVVGAGQSAGEGIGNGRATVLRFAQEGAKILAVDRDLVSAEETAALAAKFGGREQRRDLRRSTGCDIGGTEIAMVAEQGLRPPQLRRQCRQLAQHRLDLLLVPRFREGRLLAACATSVATTSRLSAVTAACAM